MTSEDIPTALQTEISNLMGTLQGFEIVEAVMRLRALQELNEALGSDALIRLVAVLTGGL